MPTDQQVNGGSGPCEDRWHCSTVGSAVISHGAVTARRIMSGCSLAHTEAFLFLTDFTDHTDSSSMIFFYMIHLWRSVKFV